MTLCWLLTSTTYGTWLAGDARGFVSNLKDKTAETIRHNQYGQPFDADWPALEASVRRAMKGPAVRLSAEQAAAVLAQFRETATYRHWLPLAAAVMSDHFHVVIQGDARPERMLGDLNGYASRVLSGRWSKPASGTWWTTSGSKRLLQGDAAVVAAVRYVQAQKYPLAVWTCDEQ